MITRNRTIVFLLFLFCSTIVRSQFSTENKTIVNIESEEDVNNVFEIFPCNGSNKFVEIFDKRTPEYYNLIIVLKNFDSFPHQAKIKLSFDELSDFKLNSGFSSFFSDSYNLEISYDNQNNSNISILVSPLKGKGNPYPNLIAVKINNEVHCNHGHIVGFWDRFIAVEPFYSGAREENITNSRKNINQKKEVLPIISTASRFKDSQCGQILKLHEELIHHGEAVSPGTWPWHAALYRVSSAKGELKYICGGTLVSKTIVVTAGHCVVERGDVLLPERLSVVLGKVSFIGRDYGSQEKGVFDIILHPEFSPQVLENDIAILKLSTQAKFTEYVQPACLPDGSKGRSSIFGKYGFVVGWGATETAKYSPYLKQARLPVKTDLECVKNNPSFFGKFLDEKSFCAGYINGTSPCNGDSGGGFFMQQRDSWQLIGITSLGVSKKDLSVCDPDYYTKFTDVAQYLDFIEAAGGLL